MRSFDPRLVGRLECQTWVTYYRHQWGAFMLAAIRVVHHAFGLPWPQTLLGAWWVLRANQVWAPYPDHRPDAARSYMRRFYGLVARAHGESFDVPAAARLEVGWWAAHRDNQHGELDPPGEQTLVAALQELYAHVYCVPAAEVRIAAEERARAMTVSDQWVRDGCDSASPALAAERAALVRSYAALLAAVHTA